MTPEQFIAHLRRQEAEIKLMIERTLPIKVGEEAVQHFKDNINVHSGFMDGGVKKWIPAKRLTSKYGDKLNKTLLSPRNHLRDSIERVSGGAGVVVIRATVPYAKAHNEGTTTAGRNRNVTLPKRQFIGDSKELTDKIERIIEEEVQKVLRG